MATVDGKYYGKGHFIFEKDVQRVMFTENIIKHSKLVKKPAGEKSILEFNNNKYKTRS